MPDARVIPISGSRADESAGAGGSASRAARGTRPAGRTSASETVAAGAARASGERARRRQSTTPLLREPTTTRPDPTPSTRDAGLVEDATPTEDAAAAEDSTLLEEAAKVGAELGEAASSQPAGWERRAASALAFLRRRLTGDYAVDEFGFDQELTDTVLLAAARPLYEKWFRVDTLGMDNVPDTGGALVVANHSGTIAIDAVMTQLALLDHHPARRSLRMLGADLVFSLPFVGEYARKSGATLACSEDAQRLLSAGELVGVWPEGFKGIGKPFSERYKLQRFGRGGFVAGALRTGTPIVPCSIVGAEEIYPILGNMRTLARLLGVPYVPVTPTFPWLGPLGLVPLPSKWMIEFGEPIETASYGAAAAEDPMLVFNLTDQVRETIQHTLYKLLMQRRSVFF